MTSYKAGGVSLIHGCLLSLKSCKLGPIPRMSVSGLGSIQATDDSLYSKVGKRNKHINAVICFGTPIKKFKSCALSVFLRGCCDLKAATFDEILGTYREQIVRLRF